MKHSATFMAISGLLLISSCGSNGNSGNISGADSTLCPREALAKRLTEVHKSGRTMFGHHDDPVYGHSWSGDSGRSDVLETAGDYPAVMSWDLGAIERGDSLNLDGVPFKRIRQEIIDQNARGGFSTISWHLFNPRNGSDSWTIGDSLTVQKILNDPDVNKAFRRQLGYVAGFLNSLSDEQGNDVAVVFRPWHEHTGSWFWWGADYCTPEEYRKLWEITRSELDAAGVDNVLYAYSPDRVPDSRCYLERYPGDDYVDIMGADVYHFGGADGTEQYRQAASAVLSIVDSLATAHDKIPAFTETGLESVSVDDWWTSVLLPLLKEHHPAYVVVWRNAHDKPQHFYAPYPGHASENSFKQFYNDKTTIFAKDSI